jgi:hypothetical protein
MCVFVCVSEEYVCSYGLCPQVTAPIPYTLEYICPEIRDALTTVATGITTRTASAKTQMRPAQTMTTDQVSRYVVFNTPQNLSLFCRVCSGKLSLLAVLYLCNSDIKSAWDAEAVCHGILYRGRRLTCQAPSHVWWYIEMSCEHFVAPTCYRYSPYYTHVIQIFHTYLPCVVCVGHA